MKKTAPKSGNKPVSRFCGPETRKHIRRNTRRAIGKYRTMAYENK